MRLSIKDALNILGIDSTEISKAQVRQAYRKAASLYHPDRNPAGLEMMQLVNSAYEALQDFEGTRPEDADFQAYGQALNEALNAVIALKLSIEICGAWIWVFGNTKPHKETLKAAGFLWASKKGAWYFRPPSQSKKRGYHKVWSMEKIRDTYGSRKPRSHSNRSALSYPQKNLRLGECYGH